MIYLKHGEEPVGIAVLTAPRPHGEKTSYSWERFGVKVAYEYLNVLVVNLEDAVLLAEDSRIGIIFYAAKCVWHSGNDEGKKFQYLRVITSLWAERGWDRDDKRLILLAIHYLINLKNEDYAKQYATHMETLNMKKEDREMYVDVLERVYTARGEEKGRMDVARKMLNKGLTVEKVVEYTDLPREEVETLLSD
jgi:hypothetical protein